MAEKRLYTVTVEHEIVVVAESEAEAEEAARDADLDPFDFDVSARPMAYLPGSWNDDCIPFGDGDESDPDRTIKTWIEKGAAPDYVAMQEKLKAAKRSKESP